MGVWGRDWGNKYLRGVWAVAVIGDVNIVGVGDEVGERGRDWNTDIVGVETEILEYVFNVTDSKNT